MGIEIKISGEQYIVKKDNVEMLFSHYDIIRILTKPDSINEVYLGKGNRMTTCGLGDKKAYLFQSFDKDLCLSSCTVLTQIEWSTLIKFACALPKPSTVADHCILCESYCPGDFHYECEIYKNSLALYLVLPEARSLITYVTEKVNTLMNSLITASCFGCETGAPGQSSHDCLGLNRHFEEIDVVSNFFQQSYGQLSFKLMEFESFALPHNEMVNHEIICSEDLFKIFKHYVKTDVELSLRDKINHV